MMIVFRNTYVRILLTTGALALISPRALADEGGVNVWLQGTFGSFAAVPGQPGFSGAFIYYHTRVGGGADVSQARQINLGGVSTTATTTLNANLNASADLMLFAPSYTFATPVLGGQAAVSLTGIYGRTSTSLAGTLLAGVGGVSAERSGQIADAFTGLGDLPAGILEVERRCPQFHGLWNG
jgi:hypothetical protein